MAIGDDARAAGFALVPSTGEEGRVRWGYREINRTRDYIAQAKTQLTAALAAKPKTGAGKVSVSFSNTGAATISHNLGWTPVFMSFSPYLSMNLVTVAVASQVGAISSNKVIVIGYDRNGNRISAATGLTLSWFASA